MSEPTRAPRPSSMGQALACPASHHPQPEEPLIEIRKDADAAAMGQAVHKAMERFVLFDEWDLPAIAGQYRVNLKELSFLAWAARDLWEKIEGNAETWRVEEEIETDGGNTGLPQKGTPDLVGLNRDARRIVIPDYKSGRIDYDCEPQMRDYGHIAVRAYANEIEAEEVTAVIFWLRDRELQAWTWTRDEIDEWAVKARKTIWEWDGKSYSVGPGGGGHCRYCPKSSTCIARLKKLAELAEALRANPYAFPELTPEEILNRFEGAKALIGIAKLWQDLAKQEILRDGPRELPGGRELAVVEEASRYQIDTTIARGVLTDKLGWSEADIDACTSFSKSAIETVAASKVEKGLKTAAKIETLDTIKAGGTMTVKMAEKLKSRKRQKPIKIEKAPPKRGRRPTPDEMEKERELHRKLDEMQRKISAAKKAKKAGKEKA